MKKAGTCNNRNPAPPCKEGYEIKKNPKNEDCCYKVAKVSKPKKASKKADAFPHKEEKAADAISQNEKSAAAEKNTPKKDKVEKKASCSSRNPAPPCKEGYRVKKNSKNEDCCYKIKTKELKDKQKAEANDKALNAKIETDSNNIQNIDPKLTHYKHSVPKHDVTPASWALPNQTAFANWLTSTFVGYRKVVEREVESEVTAEQLYLFPHQRFVRDYLQSKSPYRGLLVYHGLGVGKSCTSIAAAEMLMNQKKVVVMLPASLRTNYINEVIKCGNKYYNKNAHHWVFVPGFGSLRVSKADEEERWGVGD